MAVETRSTTGPAQRELVITREFDAPRELVYEAWTDPQHAAQWWGPRHHPARLIKMDVRPGGAWRHCLQSTETGDDLWHGGVFREVVPPERLVFTFAWEEEGERGLETLVTVTFADIGGRDPHDAHPDAVPVRRRARRPRGRLEQHLRPAGGSLGGALSDPLLLQPPSILGGLASDRPKIVPTENSHRRWWSWGSRRRYRPILRPKGLPMRESPETSLQPPSQRSQRGLDWFVFFLADVQTSFVPFVSVYLTTKFWTQSEIGLVLSIGALVALLGQIPGGALVDAVRSERLLAAGAVATIGLSALVLVAYPSFGVVLTAAIMQAGANCVLGPVVAAISLGLVGHAAVGERLGRNARFTAVGSITAAAIMGAWGYFFSTQTVFLVIVGLCIPAIVAINFVRAEEIDVERSHGGKAPGGPSGPGAIFRNLAGNGPLVTFALCALLFNLANAAMMPQIAGRAAVQSPEWATTLVSAYVIVPQLVVAFLSPSVGRWAQAWGRRPFILAAFAALATRGLLYAFVSDPFVVLAIQVLDGISGSILSVMVALVIADVTRGSGHFNLAVGTVGTCMGLGASLSTLLGGYTSTAFGSSNAFLILSAIAMLGLAFAFTRMPETRPDD